MRGLFSMLMLLAKKPPDTKAKSQRYLQPLLSFFLFFFYNHSHKTHPQICGFFLKCAGLKNEKTSGWDRVCIQYVASFLFLIFVPAAALLFESASVSCAATMLCGWGGFLFFFFPFFFLFLIVFSGLHFY